MPGSLLNATAVNRNCTSLEERRLKSLGTAKSEHILIFRIVEFFYHYFGVVEKCIE